MYISPSADHACISLLAAYMVVVVGTKLLKVKQTKNESGELKCMYNI